MPPKTRSKAAKFPQGHVEKSLLQKMYSRKQFCTPRILQIHRPDVVEGKREVKRLYDFKHDTRIMKAVSEFMSMLPAEQALTFDREPYPWRTRGELINRLAVVGPLAAQVLFEYAFVGLCSCLDAAPFDQLVNEFANDLPRLLLLCEFRIRCANLGITEALRFDTHFALDRARTAVHRRMMEHLSGRPWNYLRKKCNQKLVNGVVAEISEKFRQGEAIPSFVGRLPNELKFHILRELVRSGPSMTSTILGMRMLNKAWKRETDRLLRMPHLGVNKRTVNVCDWLRGNEYWSPPDTESFNIFASRQTAARMLPLLSGKAERSAHVCVVFRPYCRRQLLLRAFLRTRTDIKFTVVIHLDEYDEINLHTIGWRDVQNVLNALDAPAPPPRAPRVTPQVPAAAAAGGAAAGAGAAPRVAQAIANAPAVVGAAVAGPAPAAGGIAGQLLQLLVNAVNQEAPAGAPAGAPVGAPVGAPAGGDAPMDEAPANGAPNGPPAAAPQQQGDDDVIIIN